MDQNVPIATHAKAMSASSLTCLAKEEEGEEEESEEEIYEEQIEIEEAMEAIYKTKQMWRNLQLFGDG